MPNRLQKIADMIIANFEGDLITIAAPIADCKKRVNLLMSLLPILKKGFIDLRLMVKPYRFKSEDDIKNLKLGKRISIQLIF